VSFPRRLLAPGENIVVEANPNWSILVRPVAVSALIVAASAAVAVYWSTAPHIAYYVLVTISLLALIWLCTHLLSWRSRLLVITTERVVYRSGVLRRTGREIPLDRVQDVTYHQTLFSRLIGAGTLIIESAGSSGKEPFPDIAHPAEMQSLINRLITAQRTGVPFEDPAGGDRSDGEQHTDELPAVSQPLSRRLAELDQLHEAGVITAAEYARARSQLLGSA
jgi:membrane protein YdbS with pleckstrin-like domain